MTHRHTSTPSRRVFPDRRGAQAVAPFEAQIAVRFRSAGLFFSEIRAAVVDLSQDHSDTRGTPCHQFWLTDAPHKQDTIGQRLFFLFVRSLGSLVVGHM